MRVYTSHLPSGRVPVLVREGFSLPAALFGGFWLLRHAAWVPGLLLLAVDFFALAAFPSPAAPYLLLALVTLQGLCGGDLRRWGLRLRGVPAGPVVAAPNADAALMRLLSRRPEWLAGKLR